MVQWIRDMVKAHGFSEVHIPGFWGFDRTHDDGRAQRLKIFRWSNAKLAASEGIPGAYLVVAPIIDAGADPYESGRFIIPEVEWPAPQFLRRPRADVVAEFNTVIMPMFDEPLPAGQHLFDTAPARNAPEWFHRRM